MKVTIDLKQAEFERANKKLLKENLGLKGDADLERALPKLTKTALLEYLNMFLEKGMSNRADEVKQDRLYFMIQHYYADRIPTEAEISSIFQLTNSQSKTLLRNTNSRYRTKIARQIDASLREVVESAKWNKGRKKYEMVIESDVIREELDLIVTQNGPTLAPLRKKRLSACQYEAEPDTYDMLKRVLGI